MLRYGKFIIGLFVLIAILSASSGFYEDWLWFRDLGYSQLFWTPLLSKWLIQTVNGTILFAFIVSILLSVRHAIVTFVNHRLSSNLHLVQNMDRQVLSLNQKKVTIWLVILSAVISFSVSFVAGFTGWLEVLTFVNATPFGKVDPIFGKELSFYFFKLPFLQTLYNAFFGPLFLLTLFTGLFYLVTGILRFRSLKLWESKAVEIGMAARRHLALLIGILFVFKAFGYFLDIFQMLYSVHGHVVGAGYTDLNANLPVLIILIVLSILGFLLSWSGIIIREVRLLTLPVTGIFVLGILLYGIYPSLIQSFIVIPNELAKEAPYIQNEIALTRFGYGLDKIQEQDYPGDSVLTVDSLKSNQETLNNIRLNDPRPMLQTYNQKQGIRLYYKFNDIDIDRYTINKDYRQVMLSARELSSNDLDPKAKTFVNTRFKYTHGFGVSASFANAVTSEGLPSFAIKDVPSVTDFDELKIKEPRIYYGELTNDWVVVNTSVKEFDYPLGNTNSENNYQGSTGIMLTPLNKLMISLHHGTIRLYFANEVNSQSRLLINRNIKERVQKLAPFLTYDADPYLVIDNGQLKWIMDAYTTSAQLPYASKYSDQNFNYIRNTVKVVVDAYDGTVDFYAVDTNDPILATYIKIFPGVFKDIASMPASLKSHLRYPETLFTVQSNMLKTFHMTNPSVFYNKEDAWDIAKELYLDKPQNVDPYYTIMKIPGEDKPEFVLMLPFTPASSTTNTRNNMVSWLAARMDGDKYGQLLLYKLPKNTEIDGPLQIESRIDQDPEISKQLSLWDQKGSSIIRGNLLAFPLGGNFLYVEPIYMQSDKNGSIPEIKRVILAYQDRLVMAENLGQALVEIFGENAPQPTTLGQGTLPIVQTLPGSVIPSSTKDETINSMIEQINQFRSILDSIESQIKGSSNG
ncbi:UPF0182 family protein [Desulfosporosinus sp. BG]|uniref:UPF0182 family membrane protein n=1 Tax=Desulfosporosinus sp. BG TaxID=1633135 RepID=UPI00083B182D|nr:UPF0182 family protein [Desulfosporosinus sp. BG]ODA43055.1 membrane protein (Rhomboid family) [Desulfosporosinus sp. BG]